MTWWGGQAWVNYLTASVMPGRPAGGCPLSRPVNGSFDYNWSTDGSTDIGYNTTAVNATASELPHVYYNELGNLGTMAPATTSSPITA